MAEIEQTREGDKLVVRAPAGLASLDLSVPGLARIHYEGIGLEAFFEPISSEIERRGRFPIVLAVDGEALSSYETGFRRGWTEWMAAKKPRAVLILSNSRVVAMGISLTNAVLGGVIRGFSSRAEFERAIAGALDSERPSARA